MSEKSTIPYYAKADITLINFQVSDKLFLHELCWDYHKPYLCILRKVICGRIQQKGDGNANNFSGVIKEPVIHHRGIS